MGKSAWAVTIWFREHKYLAALMALTLALSFWVAYYTAEPTTTWQQDNAQKQSYTEANTTNIQSIVIADLRALRPSFNKWTSSELWIGFLHVSLPALVLIVELYMLYRMVMEQGERKKTDDALKAFRAAMGRQNYLDQIASAISTAKSDVVFTTSTMEASWHSDDQKKIFDAVSERFGRFEKAKKDYAANHDATASGHYENGPVFRHRGLVAKKPGTLPGAIELLCLTGVEIKMSPIMAMSRLRFFVQDTGRSVIGIAEGPSELARENPSSISFSLDSTMLALALRERFEILWEGSSDPFIYLSEFIIESKRSNPNQSQDTILKWLKAQRSDKDKIHNKLKDKCEAYASLPPGNSVE